MEQNNAVNTTDSAASQKDVVSDVDLAEKLASLETEKKQLEEERNNWKTAALKYKGKAREDLDSDEDEERIASITKKALAESRLADIAREQQAIIEKTLKENRELKLAHLNKNTPPAAVGTHSESTPVRDTSITPEQMAFFKSRGWNDKDIERYKKNLAKRI